jgi:hypothetical protein
VFVRLSVASPACGEIIFEDMRQHLHDDRLDGSGQPKHLTEIPGNYLLLTCILKTRRSDLLQISQRAENLAVNLESLQDSFL